MGVVLNRVNLRSVDYYQSYRYYGSYYKKDDDTTGTDFTPSETAPPVPPGQNG